MTQWGISDIHGCIKTFKALLDKVQFAKEDDLYLLGDYIDRGPDSKGVIDHIWHLQKEGYSVHCLRGNHEELAIGSRRDKDYQYIWLTNGGAQTLASFGVDAVNDLPIAYLKFMNDLPHFFELEKYILVHAGLNFRMPNPLENLQSMLWIRRWYPDINLEWLGDRIIVHGHTPQTKQEIEDQLEKLATQAVIDIDCGCVYNSDGMGYLCAFDLTNKALIFQLNIDR